MVVSIIWAIDQMAYLGERPIGTAYFGHDTDGLFG